MTVIGFQFTKILAERLTLPKGKINIQNNVSLTNVEEAPLMVKSEKQGSAKVYFSFTSKYEPKYGLIDLQGEVVWMDDKKNIQAMVSEWKKAKKLPKEMATPILNTVIQKSNIQALVMSRDVSFPPPLQLPKLK